MVNNSILVFNLEMFLILGHPDLTKTVREHNSIVAIASHLRKVLPSLGRMPPHQSVTRERSTRQMLETTSGKRLLTTAKNSEK